MGRLNRVIGFVLASMTVVPAGAAPPVAIARFQPFIEQASIRFGIPTRWIERVMAAESAGRTEREGRPIRSLAGAIGLMQLMPATWEEMRVRHGLGPDPDDPHDNILAGTAYLRAMYDRFGYPGLFAAYNAGPARTALHFQTGVPLPVETRAYLAQVTSGEARPAPTAANALFVLGPSSPPPVDSLFAIRPEDRHQSSGGM